MVTILAAVIAGAGVVAAAFVTANKLIRQEERRRQAEREQWRVDVRQAAYVDLLKAAALVVNLWWETADMLRHSETDSARKSYGMVVAAWPQYVTAMSVAVMQGPGDAIEEPLEELRVWLRDFDRNATKVYRLVTAGKKGDFTLFDDYFRSFRDVHHAFARKARVVLDRHV